MTALTIREPTLADADVLGEIHILAWQQAYRGLLPDEYLDSLSIPERQGHWRRLLSRDAPNVTALVAEEESVAGFAMFGRSRDDDAAESSGELWAINVHPDRWRHGIGRLLVDKSLSSLRGMGYERATLWVQVGNEQARRFYEALGWRCEGVEQEEQIWGAEVHEVRYAIDV